MGCGSSSVPNTPVKDGDTQTDPQAPVKNKTVSKTNSRNKIIPLDNNENRNDLSCSNSPVKKAIAFEVDIGYKKLSNPLSTGPPRRLQKLEPLSLPKLTPEMLAEKQRQVEEKRQQVLKKKANASSKSSKRRRELLKARQFEREQTSEQLNLKDEQQKQADIRKEARLKEIQEKQRLREERARRAREKAKRLKDEDEDLNIEVEKDTEYNNSDDDSWLGDDDKNSKQKQRIESGYSSPKKKMHDNRPSHPMSASTVDSFDTAFIRNPSNALKISQDTDDFFDS